jgi:hypothetical protein
MDQRVETPGPNAPVTRAPWVVNWSAVWVGALAAVAALVVFGLIGASIGLHLTGQDARITDWKSARFGAVIFSVLSAFFAFVIAGWAAGRIGGFALSEPAMLHGAIAWVLAVPILVAATAVGAGSYLDNWYGGLGGTPAWVTAPATPAPNPNTAEDEAVKKQREDAAKAARNAALTAVSALLLGLIGSVLGGWMASGEPMTLRHHFLREDRAYAAGDGNGARVGEQRVTV